jgi:hypothetical protein
MKLVRVLLCTALLLATFATGWYLGKRDIPKVHAQETESLMTVPKAWGTLKATAVNGTAYVFEASDGTIRVVDFYGGGKIYATTHRN